MDSPWSLPVSNVQFIATVSSKAMASENESTSLEARISKPEETETKPVSKDTSDSKKEATTADVDTSKPTEKPEDSTLSKAQTDGATGLGGGNTGIYEPDYDVEIKLSDVQADPNNPLYSIKTFEELGL